LLLPDLNTSGNWLLKLTIYIIWNTIMRFNPWFILQVTKSEDPSFQFYWFKALFQSKEIGLIQSIVLFDSLWFKFTIFDNFQFPIPIMLFLESWLRNLCQALCPINQVCNPVSLRQLFLISFKKIIEFSRREGKTVASRSNEAYWWCPIAINNDWSWECVSTNIFDPISRFQDIFLLKLLGTS